MGWRVQIHVASPFMIFERIIALQWVFFVDFEGGSLVFYLLNFFAQILTNFSFTLPLVKR